MTAAGVAITVAKVTAAAVCMLVAGLCFGAIVTWLTGGPRPWS